MPNISDHLKKAKHNEDFYSSFDITKTDYKDWTVVGIFYTALHLVDAYFAQKNVHPFAHGMRDEWVKKDWKLIKIYPDYRDLKEYRQKASYKIYDFKSEEVKNDVIPLLDSIKTFLKNLTPPICY